MVVRASGDDKYALRTNETFFKRTNPSGCVCLHRKQLASYRNKDELKRQRWREEEERVAENKNKN